MRILFVTPVVPSRAYGRRPYNFLRYLRGKHDLTLATFLTDPEYDRRYIKELQGWGIEVHTVRRPLWRSVLSSAAAPVRMWPLRAAYCRSRELLNLVRKLVDERSIEVLHMDRMRMGQYGFGIRGPVRVVDFTDALNLFLERKRAFHERFFWSLVDRWEYRTIPAFESQVLRNSEGGLFCSTVDTEYFLAHHPGASVRTIPNVVDPEEFHPKGTPETTPCGIYTGTLSYAPNVDALEFLVNEILPKVRRSVPGFTLKVYGTRPSAKVCRLLDREGIVSQINVPRLGDELTEHDIYLCPIRIASGMRNKILEAMATGMPVVTTTLGAEGLVIEDNREILVRDEPDAFAEGVVELFRNRELRRRIASSGKNYVLRHHLPQVAGESLEALYKDLLSKAGQC